MCESNCLGNSRTLSERLELKLASFWFSDLERNKCNYIKNIETEI